MSLSRPQERLSFLLLPVDALAFWGRNQIAFWIAAFPIAVFAGALDYFLPAGELASWPLFTLVYALFLDRWQRIALLENAPISDEADSLRRVIIAGRFLLYAIGAYVLAMAAATLPGILGLLLWCLMLAPLLLLLPSLSAGEEIGLPAVWRLGRPVQIAMLLLIAAVATLSLLARENAPMLIEMLPRKPWIGPVVAGLEKLVDCFLLALAGRVLVSLFRALTGWQPPEPEDRPYRFTRRRIS